MNNEQILKNFSFYAMHECLPKTRILTFDNGKNNCRKKILDAKKKYKISILNYFIDDNQFQIIINGNSTDVTNIVRYTSSITAAEYSQRTEFKAPFWNSRYNLTLIQNGIHLLRLSLMLDRIMIDKEKSLHQADYVFSGYRELTGIKAKYRVVDLQAISKLTGFNNKDDFRLWYIGHSSVMSESVAGILTKVKEATFIGGEDEMKEIAVFASKRGQRIELLVSDDKLPTYALFLPNRRRRIFTRSLK